jgi:hypothetical protein
MKVTHPIADKIVQRLRSRKGLAVPTRDFLDLGSRSAVDQALSRLVRKGEIRRIRRGLYELPRIGKLFNRPVAQSPDELIRAWARNHGLRVVPSGAQAANLLGLSKQVPARLVYYTNGRTQTISLGPYSIRLLNRGPKTMDIRGKGVALVFQALRYLGSDGITPEVIQRLRSLLSGKDKAELRDNLRYVSAWMKPVIEKIAGGETD